MATSPLSEADIFSRLLANLRLCEEAAYVLGHYHKAQDDFEKGQGFLAVGEMFKMTILNITNLATGSLRKAGGFK